MLFVESSFALSLLCFPAHLSPFPQTVEIPSLRLPRLLALPLVEETLHRLVEDRESIRIDAPSRLDFSLIAFSSFLLLFHSYALSVFKTTSTTSAATPAISGWKYTGCYTDSGSSRALTGYGATGITTNSELFRLDLARLDNPS